jgi:hypothetical protein
MPDRQALYLFKAARRPYYRKENLHLLAAERGSVVEVAYNRMWVAPEYFDEGAIPRGTIVYFVFTERPYSLFVPVRQGEVVDVQRDELMLRLRVLLRSWVGVEDRDLVDFTRLVKQTHPGLAPGNKFVIPKRDGIPLQPFFDEREAVGWRNTIDHLLEMSRASEDDPYRQSVFFRPAGLRVGDEVHVARRVPLEPGTSAALQLQFYNPHLTEEDVQGYELRVLAPEDTLTVATPAHFPLSGDLELELETHGGTPELTVQIGPVTAQHTSVTERFVTRGQEARLEVASPAEEGATAAPREELLRLYEFIQRNARFNEGDDLDLLDTFEHLLPGEQRIRERRAVLLAQRGDPDRAFAILRDLNPETLGDEARFRYFQLLLQRDAEGKPVRHVVNLDLTAEGRFPRLLDELAALDERTLGRLLPELILELPRDQLRDLVARVGDRITSPSPLANTALGLWQASEDPRWAYGYLWERRHALRIDDPTIEDALIELATQGGADELDADLAEVTAHRVGNLIERDRIPEALERLERAQTSLQSDERERLYHSVADRLARRGRQAAAAELLVRLAWIACYAGELESATRAVERARTLVVSRNGDPLPDWLRQVAQHVEAAWADCGELVEWRRSAEARQRELLRAQLLNRRILIAGGFRQQSWIEHLQDMTGAEVDWAERYRDEGDDLNRFAQRIRQQRYAMVVHLWQKSGHEVQDRLRDACTSAGVPWVKATSAGARGLVEAVVAGVEPV